MLININSRWFIPVYLKSYRSIIQFIYVSMYVSNPHTLPPHQAHTLPSAAPQIMLQLMQKMELLLGKTPPEDVCSDVLPLLYRALECDMQQIQELCLSVIPSCAQLVETHAMKNALLPKIKTLCLATGYLSVSLDSSSSSPLTPPHSPILRSSVEGDNLALPRKK